MYSTLYAEGKGGQVLHAGLVYGLVCVIFGPDYGNIGSMVDVVESCDLSIHGFSKVIIEMCFT